MTEHEPAPAGVAESPGLADAIDTSLRSPAQRSRTPCPLGRAHHSPFDQIRGGAASLGNL
ncbi:MAG: hypothetical protein M3536_06770 [Actinomycetota bacterium]|nr:hypothetical protein [Actinomycetota bacterium]